MKIGFYAMSGVRVCDSDLMAIGLTLPGFVERSQVIASLPSLGLLTLAGMLDDRDEAVYRDVETGQDPPLDVTLDLVVISALTAQAFDAYRLADRYRAIDRPVAMGGLHATVLPEEALKHVDAVAVGEGETVWPMLLDDARRGRLGGIYRATDREFDLADAPMPAFHLLDMDRYNRITIQTTRGCPHRCDFCASSILLTNRYKHKPVAKVLAEVDTVVARWPRPFIEFADDNSFVNRRYWLELLPELAKRRIRWFTETDVSVAEDDALLTLMRRAGCVEVLVGLESPEAAGLDGLEVLNNWKLKRLPHYAEAVRQIQSHGIRVNGCFVLGRDGHGVGIFDRVYDAAREYELYDVQITLSTPFPGTPLHGRLKREGRLTHEGQWDRCTLFDLNFVPDGMTAEELTDGFRGLAQRLYSETETNRRRDRFSRRKRRRRGNRAA